MPTTRRYLIEIKDAETGRTILFTTADWTDKERRVAVDQTMRLAGLPDDTQFTTRGEPER